MSLSPAEAPRPQRIAERDRLLELALRPSDPRIAGAVVCGPPGVGTGALLEELCSAASREGALVLAGACGADGAPYGGLHGVVGAAIEELDRAGAARALAPLISAFALDAPGGGWRPSTADLLRGDARANLHEAVRATLLAAAAGRPALVVVRDAQRLGDDALDLLEHLCASAAAGVARLPLGPEHALRAPAIVVECVTPADGALDGAAARLLSLQGLEHVRIDGLGRDDVASWLASEPVVDRVMALTGGVPNRLALLLDALPDDLDELARKRIQTLPPDAQRVLAAVALADGLLSPSDLATVCAETELDVARSLALLRSRGLVARDGAGRLGLSQDAPRGLGGSVADDVALHRALGERLASRWALERDDALVLAAARHFVASRDRDRAVAWGLQAGAWLQARMSHHAARALYQSLLALGPEAGTERTLRLRLAESAAAVGRVDEARAELDLVLQGTDEPECSLLLRLGELHLATGQLDAAAGAIARARAASGDPGAAVRVEALGAELARMRGELREAEALCVAALAAGRDEVRADLLITLANVRLQQGRTVEARQTYAEALRTPGAPDVIRARAELNLGIIAIREGNYTDSVRRLQRSLASCEASGEFFGAALSLFNLGVASEFLERYGLAEGYYVRAVDLFDRLGRQLHVASALTSLADVYVTMGAPRRARRLLQRALPLALEVRATRVASLARQKSGLVEMELCRWSRAVPLLTEAAADFRGAGATEDLGWTLGYLARALVAAGRTEDALDAIDELRDLPLDADHEAFAHALLLEGALRLDAGDPDDALALARDAEHVFARRGQRAGRIEALTLVARALRADGDGAAADEVLDEARGLLDGLKDAVPLARRQRFLRRAVWQALGLAEAGDDGPAPAVGAVFADGGVPLASRHVPGLFGASESIRATLRAVERVAASGSPVLILGESGTGKELVAQAIHELSARRSRSYIRVNSAALPESLLESELFGHERGAFTGAVARREGKFELADGGTLFLDEIGDISAKTQVSLLRVLQEGEVQPVGAGRTRRVDVRVICATNRDLAAMVREERFRLDLFYRIRGVTIELPPLRERRGDIPLLAGWFLSRLEHGPLSLSADALRVLEAYHWPGNVRELESVLRGAAFFAEDGLIRAEHVRGLLQPEAPVASAPSPAPPMEDEVLDAAFSLDEARRRMEIRYITAALERTEGNITRAAELLKMTRPRLSQKIKEFDISIRTARDGRTR